jgi:phenylpropionate dioxygenase-like ring-hydroxylating dioxygenase large terminal subunit
MFTNFWYAAEWSHSITDKPVRVKMLGQSFVLWRDANGAAHCLVGACIHRGGALADGQVLGCTIECPYHGWRFDADGRCTRIPALGASAQIPPRARLDSYPVQERYGIVFVFLGDLPEAERPPLMSIPQWEDPKYRFTFRGDTIRGNYLRGLENAVDVSHTEFVHSHLMGYRGADRREGEYRAPSYSVSETEWGASIQCQFPPAPGWGKVWNRILGFDRIFTGMEVTISYHGPNSVSTSIYLSKKMNLHLPQFSWDTPIDEYSYRYFLVGGRNFFRTRLFDRRDRERNEKINLQDKAIIEAVEPILPPPSRTDEFLVEPDNIVGHFHNSLQQWEAKGWRIDTPALATFRPGERYFAIPSPQRRSHGFAWVHEAVPRIAARDQDGKAASLRAAH